MSKPVTTKEVKAALGFAADQVSRSKDGTFTARRGFFYTGGKAASQFAEEVKQHLADAELQATVQEHGEVLVAFKGGAPVSRQSHWWVKFTVARG